MIRGLGIGFAATLALGLWPVSAAAADPVDFSDYEVEPWRADLGQWEFSLKGAAWGAAYSAKQPDFAGLNATNITGAAQVAPSLTRIYDSGMTLSFNTVLTVWHDRLSGDNFGSRLFQKAYAALQLGLGRIEIGMNDGPSYNMAIVGPNAADYAAVDGSNTSFFIDPTTGESFTNLFSLNTAGLSTQNYAKIAYYSPEVFGVKVGLAYTPSTAKDVIPFAFAAQKIANRQEDFWEAAVNYRSVSDEWTFSSYAAFVFAHNAAKLPGGAGLTDWGAGAQVDYTVDEETSFSFGGGYRETNAYTLDTFMVGARGVTRSMRGALGFTQGPWNIGAEFAYGRAQQPGQDEIEVDGLGISAGYSVNANLLLTAGWQSLRYWTDNAFYDGSQRIRLNAFFLHASFTVDDPE